LKKLPISNCRYCADRTKNLPRPVPCIWLTLFQISSKSVHFWRSYCRTREDRVCPVEYLQYSLFEPIITVAENFQKFKSRNKSRTVYIVLTYLREVLGNIKYSQMTVNVFYTLLTARPMCRITDESSEL